MNQMYMANRLFINFFQPSFKLLDTQRIGGKTVRRHGAPKTPYNRRIELHALRSELRYRFDDIIHALDPLKLLETIRLYQHHLARIAVGNPLHHPALSKPRHWRTRADPFADVWNEMTHIRENSLKAIAEHCNAGCRNGGSGWPKNKSTELVRNFLRLATHRR